jgi:hypothetical protein
MASPSSSSLSAWWQDLYVHGAVLVRSICSMLLAALRYSMRLRNIGC